MEIAEKKQRIDLQVRREIKYILSNTDLGKIRTLLKGSCNQVVYNKEVSVVRSIYFDDWRLTMCQANLDGIGRRKKVRIRWYDSVYPLSKVFFEIKWRNNWVTGKRRLEIGSKTGLQDITYKDLISQLKDILFDEYKEMLFCFPEPVIIVEYKREHFVSVDEKYRLTLDYDMVFYDQMGVQKPYLESPVPMLDMAILECKTAQTEANNLKSILYPFTPCVSRFSKYVTGCNMLGLINSGIGINLY